MEREEQKDNDIYGFQIKWEETRKQERERGRRKESEEKNYEREGKEESESKKGAERDSTLP